MQQLYRKQNPNKLKKRKAKREKKNLKGLRQWIPVASRSCPWIPEINMKLKKEDWIEDRKRETEKWTLQGLGGVSVCEGDR